MSGLGSTISADGEQGIDNAPAPIPAGSTRDQPAQIAQTTSAITLPVLSEKDWIYKAAYTVSTEMPPGTVFAIIPNHPEKCNYVTAHISQLFNTWCGILMLRFRLLATAFYGGSIRVAILPPSFTEQEIGNLPLDVLTAYANTDLDPKNTIWNHISSTDQREYAFHYMKPYDTNDRTTFGGYIVFFVAGKLVTQSPEISTIQMIVESRGQYIYDQPKPLTSVLTSQPLSWSSYAPLIKHSVTEAFASIQSLMVLPATVLSTIYGNVQHAGVGKQAGPSNAQFPGRTITNPKFYDLFYSDLSRKSNFPPSWHFSDGRWTHPSSRPTLDFNSNLPAVYSEVLYTGPSTTPTVTDACWVSFTEDGSGFFRDHKNDTSIKFYNDLPYMQCLASQDANGFKIKQCTEGMNGDEAFLNYPLPNCRSGASLSPQVGGESIVMFANLDWAMASTQTNMMFQELSDFPSDLSQGSTSWLYQLINKNGTPILTLRLNPNGVFTTNRAAGIVKYPVDEFSRLRFLQELPINSPLPPQSVAMQAIRSELTFNSRTKITQALQANLQAISSY